MSIEPEREADRILRVYRSYGPSVRRRWDRQNLGNQWIEADRWRLTEILLQHHGFLPLGGRSILDVGCGSGGVLRTLLAWGAQAQNCVGIDLIPESIEEARQRHPGVRFLCANAEHLGFPDNTFDIVLASTVFSSILSGASSVAREISRILKPGGALLWYDFRYNSPANPYVRGVSRRAIRRLFPQLHIHLRTTTLLPPLARRLGRSTPVIYPILTSIPVLRTHYIGLLIKTVTPEHASGKSTIPASLTAQT